MNALTKDFCDAVEQKMTDFGVDVATVRGELFKLEQNLAMRGHGVQSPDATWGSEFVENKSAEVAGLLRGRGSVGMEVKATITSTTGAGLIVPQRDQVLGMPQRRLTVRNLMTTVQVSSGSVEYPRMTGRPTGADTVAEGALKPESAMTFDLVNAPIRTIAHWIPASLQVLDDAPQLRDLIDTELLYGLAVKEESQLLNGSGVAPNLTGMVTTATAADPAAITALGLGATPSRIDRLAAAIYQASLTEISPDGIVMHPADWWAIRLSKNADGDYILGDPGVPVAPSLWGIPVVPTQAMAATKFLLGAFKAQTLYDRWQPRIEISTQHADFFTRNLCAIRAELRIGSAVKRPEALIYGTFS